MRSSRASRAAIPTSLLIALCGCNTTASDGDDGGGGRDSGSRDSGSLDATIGSDAGHASDGGSRDAGGRGDGGVTACNQPIPDLSGERITTTSLNEPVFLAQPPGSSDLYVAERLGLVRIVRGGTVLATPFLDVRSRLGDTSDPTPGDERGLLGLAFHPDYATNGRFFVYFAPLSDDEGTNVVAEGRRSANADRAEESLTPILTIPDFAPNHNGGMLAFGRDGYLYVGTGDGGGGGDPEGNGQDLRALLGKLLRLDVNAPAPHVPATNPFVGTAGAQPLIWAYGMRNPWRFSFDRETGDLWIGDVGQDLWEEIDFQPANSTGGENYGWSAFEGTHAFEGGSRLRPGSVHTPPIYEYPQERDDSIPSAGESVTGGYVYRGNAIPALRGAYVFADLMGSAAAFRYCDGQVTNLRALPGLDSLGGRYVYSFAEDASGELYILFGSGQVFRITAAN